MSESYSEECLQLSPSLKWLGQAACGDLLVVETRLFYQGQTFSASTDACRLMLFKGLSNYDRQAVVDDYRYFRQLRPAFVSDYLVLPLSDEQTVKFHLGCVEVLSESWLYFIGSNINNLQERDILVECFVVTRNLPSWLPVRD